MKRKHCSDLGANTRQKVDHTILQKRKALEYDINVSKRARTLTLEQELELEKRKNFEMQQCIDALHAKLQTLEYMISMFQRNETIGCNKLITSY